MNGRQLLKFLAAVTLSFAVCFALLSLTGGSAAPVFEEMLSAFLVLATLLVATSVALFNYVESISKELVELRKDVERRAYERAIEKLSALKREVVSNGALVAGLFIFERTLKGLALHLSASLGPESDGQFTTLSLRFSAFVVAVVAASSQIRGFWVAIGFRDVIATGRK